MPNEQHKKFFRFDNSQNFNSSELAITGLRGDSFDYVLHGTARDCILGLKLNADATANNRQYNMQGSASSATASVNDSTTLTSVFGSTTSGKPSAFRLIITGDSSTERYINNLVSINSAINVQAIYWKNAVDKLTSLNIFDSVSRTGVLDLHVDQVPKQANLDNYDLVDELIFTAESGTKSFTGLDGDLDKEYMIQWESDGSADVRINNLSSSIYTRQRRTNSGGSIGSNNATSTSYTDALYYNGQTLTLLAETGRKRLFKSSTSKTVSIQQSESACWVNNTVDNVTQIDIIPSGSITATAKLYRRKSNLTIDLVPMRTVVEHPINGVDFSAGITISGIEGDRIDGAIKVEFVGDGVASGPTLKLELNGDTASNYVEQRLLSTGASVSAGVRTIGYLEFAWNTLSSNTGVLYLYSNSGQNRPCIGQYETNENYLRTQAFWWNNSLDEITSMKIYASNTNAITGKLRISVPKNTTQATPSWTVTVN